MRRVRTVSILGTEFVALPNPTDAAFLSARPLLLLALNAEKLLRYSGGKCEPPSNAVFYADGIVAWLLLRLRGVPARRKPGAELWLDLLYLRPETTRVYLLGATAETNTKAREKLGSIFAFVDIVGARNGYFEPAEEASVISEIMRSKADIVFTAMGSPRQEEFMERASGRHEALYMGLGGSLDVFVGSVGRAPAAFRRLGLEWLYRFATQPSRAWRFWGNVKAAVNRRRS